MINENKLEKVLQMIRVEYDKALRNRYVNHPLSYALYNVWKQIDVKGW